MYELIMMRIKEVHLTMFIHGLIKMEILDMLVVISVRSTSSHTLTFVISHTHKSHHHEHTDTWDVSRVTDFSKLFQYQSSFNGDISKWDVSKVTHLGRAFEKATLFNGDLSKWNTAKVTSISASFRNAYAFNGNISSSWLFG